jgi:3-hydroxyisobutyrate dehydrogenase-like beta-hydroxyacid dehydrogenase
MRLGLIGAGRMGRPLALRLMAAGHELTVLARRPEARAAAEAAGLRCADTLAATVREADAVFCCVLSEAQVSTVCLSPEGALALMKPGSVLVQHTTSDPAVAQRLAEVGSQRDIHVLDAALSGGPHDITAGTLTLWVGGDEAVLQTMRPLLAAYASPITFVGAIGNGQRVKLVNNALFVAQVGLAIDAVRLAGSLGIDEPAILAALQQGSGASRALGTVARAGSVGAVPARLAELMGKDVRVVREVARRSGVDLGVLGTVLASDAVEQKVLSR